MDLDTRVCRLDTALRGSDINGGAPRPDDAQGAYRCLQLGQLQAGGESEEEDSGKGGEGMKGLYFFN